MQKYYVIKNDPSGYFMKPPGSLIFDFFNFKQAVGAVTRAAPGDILFFAVFLHSSDIIF